jgi:hypothetical protein
MVWSKTDPHLSFETMKPSRAVVGSRVEVTVTGRHDLAGTKWSLFLLPEGGGEAITARCDVAGPLLRAEVELPPAAAGRTYQVLAGLEAADGVETFSLDTACESGLFEVSAP